MEDAEVRCIYFFLRHIGVTLIVLDCKPAKTHLISPLRALASTSASDTCILVT
jgi:hypothetical protein